MTLTPDMILSDVDIISNLTCPEELCRMMRGMERNTWEAAALLPSLTPIPNTYP